MRPKKSSLTRMADRELRKIVLKRDGDCQYRRCEPGRWAGVPHDVAHLAVPRARRRTRWELDNVALLCRDCHRHLDTHPLEKEEWAIFRIGEERYRELRRLAENGEKVDTREELERLRKLRRQE